MKRVVLSYPSGTVGFAIFMELQMYRFLSFLVAFVAFHFSANAGAALRDGSYEIEVKLELPYILDTNTRKIVKLCLNSNKSVAFGLAVLSDNNPLGKCPVSNAVVSVNNLSFDISCPGVNAARGHASYLINQNNFRGRIKMKMGGKNMTMTEVQVGHRIGNCDAAKAK